jgi:hypothetical protein
VRAFEFYNGLPIQTQEDSCVRDYGICPKLFGLIAELVFTFTLILFGIIPEHRSESSRNLFNLPRIPHLSQTV